MTHTESTPTANSTDRYVVTFGSYDDAYVLDGEFASENDALVAAARHCLDYAERHHRMPDPFTVERVEDAFKADRDEPEHVCGAWYCPDCAAPAPQPTSFDERALDDTDAIIDMTGAFVTSTAAVLAIRAALAERVELRRSTWEAVQHGSRSSAWTAARSRYLEAIGALADVDRVIGERLN